MELTRRQVLALIVAVPAAGTISACAVPRTPHTTPDAPVSTTATRPGDVPSRHKSTNMQQQQGLSGVWTPSANEVLPDIKRTAADFLETAGTWSTVTDPLSRVGLVPELVAAAAIFQPSDAIAGSLRVLYPQYGGIATDEAAVISLFDQQLTYSTESVNRQMALDVRLARHGGGVWQVRQIKALTSLGEQQTITGSALAVIDNPSIILSAPARDDVGTGRVDETLLRVLTGLGEEFTFGIQVMHTGHIQTVFPTSKVSNHAVGRAADVREINGVRIVDYSVTSPVLTEFMLRASELGATEVGGPIDLNGDRAGFFSDDVHRDHIHLGVTPGDLPAQLR